MFDVPWPSFPFSNTGKGCITIPLPERKLEDGLEFLLQIWTLLRKSPQKHPDTLKFKI